MSEERQHHPYSPSTLQAREASPCWAPTNEENEASAAGIKQHNAFANRNLDDLTDEQAEAVQNCLNYFDGLLQKRECFAREEGSLNSAVLVLSEEYLPIDAEILMVGASRFVGITAGYIDAAIISHDRMCADLIDLKFGAWPVEPAETNLQGIAYLLGLVHKYPTLQTVKVHFLLPYQDVIDIHTFEAKDFPALQLRVTLAVRRAIDWKMSYDDGLQKKNLSYVGWYPTNSTCRFCSRLGRCDAALRLAAHVSKKFQPIPLPDQLDPLMVADPKHAADILKLSDLMTLWAGAVRKEITEEAIRSETAPDGYKFVSSHGKPSILDAVRVLAIAQTDFGISKEQADEAMSITLGPLEKAIEHNAQRGEKKETSKRFREVLDEAKAVEAGQPFTYLKQLTESPKDE